MSSPHRFRLSAISLGGPEHTSSCGYCKHDGVKSKTSVSFGVSAARSDSSLTCADYQALCDAGWRRSGDYLYTLSNARTCCPALTIRLDVRQFTPDKEQRRLVRRLNQYLRGEVATVQGGGGGPGDSGTAAAQGGAAGGSSSSSSSSSAPAASPAPVTDSLPAFFDAALRAAASAAFPQLAAQLSAACLVTRAPPQLAASKGAAPGASVAPSYSSALAHQLCAAARKAAGSGEPVPPAADFAARVVAVAAAAVAADGGALVQHVIFAAAPSGHVNICLPQGGVPLGGAFCCPPAPPPPASSSTAAAAAAAAAPTAAPPFPQHTWEVRTVPAAADKEAFDLYCRYQVAVHKDDPARLSMEQFTDFLCTSPLLQEPWGAPLATQAAGEAARVAEAPRATPGDKALARIAAQVAQAWQEGEGAGAGLALVGQPLPPTASAAPPLAWLAGFPQDRDHVFPDLLAEGAGGNVLAQGYGTFHQKYYLDGALVAVGVVDVLPHALSSVYVFYEPELARSVLPLGKLTALREIQWVQAACRRPCPPPPAAAPSAAAAAGGAAPPILAAASPRLCYYYLGFYIHRCPKMRYKAEYAPSEVLCPVTREAWARHGDARAALDAAPCPTLAPAGVAAAWHEGSRSREAGLGLSLARAALCLQGGGGGMMATLRELREGAAKARLMGLLRDLWLPRAGPAAGARCVIML